MTADTVPRVHRRARPLTTVLALVVALAACNSGGDDAGDAAGEPTASSTTVAPDGEAPAVTEGDPAARAAIELRGDGLGVVNLGAVPDEAIDTVSAALGEPTADSGWEKASTSYGSCPGERVRGVEWEHLVLLFTDGDTAYGRGEHLFAWRVTGAPPALGTSQGLGYQATVADAEELHPGEVQRTEADEPFPGFLTVTVDGGPITAFLDGDVITNLEAGAPCGE
ncbi:MAG: hypothetical protein ACRDYW_00725 [Acidimicrobiales bacterium]